MKPIYWLCIHVGGSLSWLAMTTAISDSGSPGAWEPFSLANHPRLIIWIAGVNLIAVGVRAAVRAMNP